MVVVVVVVVRMAETNIELERDQDGGRPHGCLPDLWRAICGHHDLEKAKVM